MRWAVIFWLSVVRFSKHWFPHIWSRKDDDHWWLGSSSLAASSLSFPSLPLPPSIPPSFLPYSPPCLTVICPHLPPQSPSINSPTPPLHPPLPLPHLLYSGSILSCLFLLLSLVGSENLKKAGANSTNHFGSMAVVSLMYSFVVRTSSW